MLTYLFLLGVLLIVLVCTHALGTGNRTIYLLICKITYYISPYLEDYP